MDTGITEKTGLVLASSKGLGNGIARSLASEGVNVTLVGRSENLLKESVKDINKEKKGFAKYICVDFSQPNATEMILKHVADQIGGVDILVNNTGGPPAGNMLSMESEKINKQLDIILMNIIRITAGCLPHMIKRGWGRIITVTSSGAIQPIDNLAVSNIVRGALVGWSKTLSNDVAKHGITVNTLLPGRIQTERLKELDELAAKNTNTTRQEIMKESQKNIPVGRYGTIEEFAAVATFLSSVNASYITGSQIRCDGGLIKSV